MLGIFWKINIFIMNGITNYLSGLTDSRHPDKTDYTSRRTVWAARQTDSDIKTYSLDNQKTSLDRDG